MIIETSTLLTFGAIMFCAGIVGFLSRRNLILIFLSLELMLAGVSMNLVAFGRLHGNSQGEIFVIMILTVAACEAALALALIVALYRKRETLDVKIWQVLRETEGDLSVAKDTLSVEESEGDVVLPKLTPAGRDPLTAPMSPTIDNEATSTKA